MEKQETKRKIPQKKRQARQSTKKDYIRIAVAIVLIIVIALVVKKTKKPETATVDAGTYEEVESGKLGYYTNYTIYVNRNTGKKWILTEGRNSSNFQPMVDELVSETTY